MRPGEFIHERMEFERTVPGLRLSGKPCRAFGYRVKVIGYRLSGKPCTSIRVRVKVLAHVSIRVRVPAHLRRPWASRSLLDGAAGSDGGHAPSPLPPPPPGRRGTSELPDPRAA